MLNSKYDIVTILGATASGKTGLATNLAYKLNGEVISADSRQVYSGMSIGTGKDIEEYTIKVKSKFKIQNSKTETSVKIPYHLIDIVDAGYQYNVYEYQRDFLEAYNDIRERNIFPVLCGGSGMYIEAVLKGYKLIQVPVNEERREVLAQKSLEELTDILKDFKQVHNTSDIENKKRAIRAIEIEEYYSNNPEIDLTFPKINSLMVGVKYDRDSRRRRITERLKQRLDEGMIKEVENLLAKGLAPEALTYYGLEYKFLTLYITGTMSYDEMFNKLNTAIHQFAKRQMTWFRKMEKEGFDIHWLDGYMDLDEKIGKIIAWLG
jgi:tRNA dimethylallyltransferase